MRPITSACTFKSLATVPGSTSRPLYRNTEDRAMTDKFGNCDRLLIRLSVIPSLRYSVFGSLPALSKGNTAMDEISLPSLWPGRNMKKIVARIASSVAAPTPTKNILRRRAAG